MYVLRKNTQISVTLVLQDIFSSGAIKSATDFQVYREVAGLSGLDFAYADNTAVYHTKVLFIFPFAPLFFGISGKVLFAFHILKRRSQVYSHKRCEICRKELVS